MQVNKEMRTIYLKVNFRMKKYLDTNLNENNLNER